MIFSISLDAKYIKQIRSEINITGLPSWLSGKGSAYQARDQGLIPGSGRSPGEGNGIPLHYSCLGNSMDREAWWATVQGVTKESGHDLATKNNKYPLNERSYHLLHTKGQLYTAHQNKLLSFRYAQTGHKEIFSWTKKARHFVAAAHAEEGP